MAINCLLIGIILFQACNSSKIITPATPHSNPCLRCDEVSLADLHGMVSYETALKLSEDYVSDSGKKLIWKGGDKTNRPDTRNVWFSLPKLKAFIGYVEQQACLAKCEKSKRLGIRVYFAKYPGSNNTPLGILPDGYQNHHTVFFTATYYDAAAKMNVDFDPAHVKTGCGFSPIHDPLKDSVFMAIPLLGSAGGDQQNHGGLVPPPDGKGAFPTVPE